MADTGNFDMISGVPFQGFEQRESLRQEVAVKQRDIMFHRSALERIHRRKDLFHVGIRHLGVAGKGKTGGGMPFGLGKACRIFLDFATRLLSMRRYRIVNQCLHLLLAQVYLERVSPVAGYHEQVIHMR